MLTRVSNGMERRRQRLFYPRLLRPETRAIFEDGIKLLKQAAPGEALLKGSAGWGLDRLWSIVFGASQAEATSELVTHQRFCRDYPSQGDASLAPRSKDIGDSMKGKREVLKI